MEKSKFIKIADTEDKKLFIDAGDKINKKEIIWSHYTIENEVGYHYYLIIK